MREGEDKARFGGGRGGRGVKGCMDGEGRMIKGGDSRGTYD